MRNAYLVSGGAVDTRILERTMMLFRDCKANIRDCQKAFIHAYHVFEPLTTTTGSFTGLVLDTHLKDVG
jgi:hypothetical protein